MNNALQREILTIVKALNEEKGVSYILVREELVKQLILAKKYPSAALDREIKLLRDMGKLELEEVMDRPDNPLRLTCLGYQEFEPWYKKTWRWFQEDFAKTLSVFSVILSIIATGVSLASLAFSL